MSEREVANISYGAALKPFIGEYYRQNILTPDDDQDLFPDRLQGILTTIVRNDELEIGDLWVLEAVESLSGLKDENGLTPLQNLVIGFNDGLSSIYSKNNHKRIKTATRYLNNFLSDNEGGVSDRADPVKEIFDQSVEITCGTFGISMVGLKAAICLEALGQNDRRSDKNENLITKPFVLSILDSAKGKLVAA